MGAVATENTLDLAIPPSCVASAETSSLPCAAHPKSSPLLPLAKCLCETSPADMGSSFEQEATARLLPCARLETPRRRPSRRSMLLQ